MLNLNSKKDMTKYSFIFKKEIKIIKLYNR